MERVQKHDDLCAKVKNASRLKKLDYVVESNYRISPKRDGF